jgi:putative flippase GtrA
MARSKASSCDDTLVGKPQHGTVDAHMQAEVVGGDADRALAAMLHRPMRKRLHPRQHDHIAWFIAVGCAAAFVHWAVVVALVSRAGWRLLVANVLGWLVAFGVSFARHQRLTFRGHGASVRSSGMRLFLVSAGGFAVNEAAYAGLLGWSRLRYDVALAAVLIVVAAIIYVLSRYWVFVRSNGG